MISFLRASSRVLFPSSGKISQASWNILGKSSKSVMVCGPKECHYKELADLISKTAEVGKRGITPDSFIRPTRSSDDEVRWTDTQVKLAEGVMQIPKRILPKAMEGYIAQEICPAGITTIVIENKKRKERGEAIIPIVFVLKYTGPEGKTFSSKYSREMASLVTIAELVRSYQHLTAQDPLDRAVAEETFVFAEVAESADGTISFQTTEAPWHTDSHREWEHIVTASKVSDVSALLKDRSLLRFFR